MAPQRLEKIKSAPVNGMGSEASSHNIWYTGARLTVRSGREPQERCRIRPARRPEGNFPPRKALKSLETEKESRKLRGRDEQTGDRAAAPAGAPLALTLAAPGLEPSPAELGKLRNSQAGSGGGSPMCRRAGNGRRPPMGCGAACCGEVAKVRGFRGRRPLLFCIFPATRRFRVGSEGAASPLSVRRRSVPPNPPPRRARAAWLRPTVRRREIA